MKRLIYLEDAIDAFEPEHSQDWYTPYIIETLESLPSAQPEVTADMVDAYVKPRHLRVISEEFYLCLTSGKYLPPIFQPEIIRCSECKYYTSVTAQCEIRGKGLYLIRGSDDFCSRAERKEK